LCPKLGPFPQIEHFAMAASLYETVN